MVRPWEEGSHAVSKFRRAISMTIAIEDCERGNITARIERQKTASKRRGAIILVYAVLWIALPPAITTAQKLEMRGQHITINTIEQSIKDEYDELKKNFKDFKKSKAYKKGEGFFSKFTKGDKTVLIVVAIAIGLLALTNWGHNLPFVMHAPFTVFTGLAHGVAPGINHLFFPGAFPIIIVLLVLGLIFKAAFKTILYIIAILLAGSLLIKMIFWMFGGFIYM